MPAKRKTPKKPKDIAGEQVYESAIATFESPESSNIHSAEYNPDTLSLTVTFGGKNIKGTVTPKTIYDIKGSFAQAEWDAFYASDSKGKFYNTNIAPFHKAVKRD